MTYTKIDWNNNWFGALGYGARRCCPNYGLSHGFYGQMESLAFNRRLNGKYLIGINVPPAEFIAWQDKSGNNNHLLAKSKKRQPIYYGV